MENFSTGLERTPAEHALSTIKFWHFFRTIFIIKRGKKIMSKNSEVVKRTVGKRQKVTVDQALTSDDQGLGNNDSSPNETDNSVRSRGWFITINNYTENDLLATKSLMENKNCEWAIIGKEVGESGTPHLQGCMHFKEKISRKQACNLLGGRAYVQVQRGTKEQQVYCTKDEDIWVKKNWETPKEKTPWKLTPKNIVFNKWQQDLWDRVVPWVENDRKVYYVYDPKGNKGKTTFAKQLVQEGHTIVVDGKSTDIYSALADMEEAEAEPPKYIIWNMSRDNKGVSYKAVEQVKDCMFFNSKYRSKMVCLPWSPVVIIFSNQPPELEKLTYDRWEVMNWLEDDEEEPLSAALKSDSVGLAGAPPSSGLGPKAPNGCDIIEYYRSLQRK